MSANFTAVWRPGTGAQSWAAGETFADFKTLDQNHFDAGLRLRILQIDSNGSHSGVWVPGTGSQHWQSGMSFEELKTLDAAFFAQGRRMVCVDCVNDLTSDDGWYAVWQPGTGAQFWRTGLSVDQFTQQDAGFFAEGLRLVHMRHDAGGSETFLGLWRPGSGAQHWRSLEPVDLTTLSLLNAQREAAGERLVALPNYGLNAIWRSGTGPSPFVFATDVASLKAEDTKLFKEGFRLSDFGIGFSV